MLEILNDSPDHDTFLQAISTLNLNKKERPIVVID